MKESNLSSNVLEILAAIIEHFGRQIAPYAQILLNFMFKLWDECGTSRALTKQTILRVLSRLVEAIPSTEASVLQTMFVPLISYCIRSQSSMNQITEPTTRRKKKDDLLYSAEQAEDDAEYLLEDGIALWINLVQQCENMSMDLAKLFEFLPSMFCRPRLRCLLVLTVRSADIARTFLGTVNQAGTLVLLQSYVCVGGPEFLAVYIRGIVEVFELILSTARPESLKRTLDAIQIFIQLYPMHAPPHLVSVLKKCAQIALEKRDNTVLETTAGALLARLPKLNQEFFLGFVQHNISGATQSGIEVLLDFWCARSRSVDYIQDIKAWVQGLSSLLFTQDSVILAQAARIVEKCVMLLRDLRVKESDSAKRRDHTINRTTRVVSGSRFERVLKQADRADMGSMPHQEVVDFFIAKLRATIQLNGPQLEVHIMNNVNPSVRAWLANPPAPIKPSNSHKITLIDENDDDM